MDPTQEGAWALAGLVLSSFLSATVLPGSSEAVLMAVLLRFPELGLWSVGLATLGNTLGGMTTYGLGWLLPARVQARLSARVLAGAQRWGALSLLLSWVPGVGMGSAWRRAGFSFRLCRFCAGCFWEKPFGMVSWLRACSGGQRTLLRFRG